jgi:2-isopropylmalate synthase
VIRVNSQSGKGGISYLLEAEVRLELPRRLQIEFSQVVQGVMDASGKELSAQDLWTLFGNEYRIGRATVAHQVLESGAPGEMVTLGSASAHGRRPYAQRHRARQRADRRLRRRAEPGVGRTPARAGLP